MARDVKNQELFPGSNFTAAEREFGAAMDRYRREHGVRFPSLRETLKVLRSLGYRKPRPRKPAVHPATTP